MARIEMKTTACGPKGNKFAGKQYNVSDAEAKGLVDGGFATIVKVAGRGHVETAESEGGEENAASNSGGDPNKKNDPPKR